MAGKGELLLSDKSVFPDDELIFSLIGEKKVLWLALMDHLSVHYKDGAGSWNYYNDGKQWLYKFVLKKKTLFWGGILPGTFRITFYFGNKAEPVIEASTLPAHIKESFRNVKRYGQIRPVTILVGNSDDIDIIFVLLDLKSKIK